MEGYTASENVVGQALDHAIGAAEGRVMVATFASLIGKIVAEGFASKEIEGLFMTLDDIDQAIDTIN